MTYPQGFATFHNHTPLAGLAAALGGGVLVDQDRRPCQVLGDLGEGLTCPGHLNTLGQGDASKGTRINALCKDDDVALKAPHDDADGRAVLGDDDTERTLPWARLIAETLVGLLVEPVDKAEVR